MRLHLGLRRRTIRTLTRVFDACGFFFGPKTYESPVPEAVDVDRQLRAGPSELVGIEIDQDRVLAFLDETVVPRLEEFRTCFPLQDDGPGFHVVNGRFMALDAHVYYGVLRQRRPRQVIEVGAGRSTQLAAAALRQNRVEGAVAELVAIDPFPPQFLVDYRIGPDRLIATKVQDVGLDLFTSLAEDDVLFIDSSHVVRTGSDVLYEIGEVLPRLSPGVLVHFHDISLPSPYPRHWFDEGVYWNEQYILQAFLAFNSRFEVLWPAAFMMSRHGERLEALFPELGAARLRYPYWEPTSFWMRVRR
jgi:hypothetical protein